MSNPFEDKDGEYIVIKNHEFQHSLWPIDVSIPDGWQTVHGPSSRNDCLSYIDANWTDMRPASLIAAMEQAQEARKQLRPS